MPDSSAHGGGDSASSTLKRQVNADLFGDDGAADRPAAADGGPDESGEPERPATAEQARDRTAASVFGDLREEETDDVDAVFDHYGVDSTEEVLSAEGSGADPGWSTDPVVIGEDDGGFGELLLDGRDEGEEFNWVATEEAVAGEPAAGDARPAESDGRPDDESGSARGVDDDRDGVATGAGPGTMDAAPGGDSGVARDDGAQAVSADEPDADEGEQAAADADEGEQAATDERPGLLRRVLRRIASLF